MENSPRDRGAPRPAAPSYPPEVQAFEVRMDGLVDDALLDGLPHVESVSRDLWTSLRGTFRDQAELAGLLATLRTLGLEVVEVRRLPPAPEPAADDAASRQTPDQTPDQTPEQPPGERRTP